MFWKRKILYAACLIGFLAAPKVFAQESSSAQIEERQKKPSWFSGDLSLDNSVGIGTFLPGYSRAPQWTTSLTISPSFILPLPQSWPKIVVESEASANIWWLNSIQTSTFEANNKIQFPDILLGISVPKMYEFSRIGISFSASLPLTLPISKPSMAMNRILGVGLSTGIKWKKGQFSVGFVPSAKAWIHNATSKTISCLESQDNDHIEASLLNPLNPDLAIDQYMASFTAFRDEEFLDGGRCTIVGRQNIWTLKNALSAAWAGESHRVSIGLAYYWNILRPLEQRPELASSFSSSQSFTQAALGKIAYTYTLPIAFNMELSTGIMSYQGIFSKTGTALFPFFDFATPHKNLTQLFVEMAASL